MTEINWGEIAVEKGLSPEEFVKQILTTACFFGVRSIDKNAGQENALRFTCADRLGKIELMIRRVENE